MKILLANHFSDFCANYTHFLKLKQIFPL